MTRLHLFTHHPRRRASDLRLSSRGRWNQPEPMKLRAGFILIGLGLALSVFTLLESTSAGADGASMLVLFASALFVFGGIWLLFALGQRLVGRLRGERKRCGCCRFYAVERGLYVIGRCQASPSGRAVTRADSCSRFCFSERAMVCDRLAQHPRMLQQLHLIGSSDAANQP
jgi:hypothetical protein